jgi:hypothetical protein
VRRRFRKMRAKARPRAPLRHCSQRGQSGVSPDSGQEETCSDRAAAILQTNFRPYTPRRRDVNPRTRPKIPNGRARNRNRRPLARSSAPYLFYVPRLTLPARGGPVKAAPRKFTPHPRPNRTAECPAAAQGPAHAHRRRFPTRRARTVLGAMERRARRPGPGVPPAYSSQRHAASAGLATRTRHYPSAVAVYARLGRQREPQLETAARRRPRSRPTAQQAPNGRDQASAQAERPPGQPVRAQTANDQGRDPTPEDESADGAYQGDDCRDDESGPNLPAVEPVVGHLLES